MHHADPSPWQHEHRFTTGSPVGERRTLLVTGLTAAMMILEIVAGHFMNSTALFADGWHMGTHVVALGISAFAYVYARRHADNPRFAFGPGKIGPLGGYTSALILAGVAIYIAFEASTRLLHPLPIAFKEAIMVACLGLAVNLLSAFLLRDDDLHRGLRVAVGDRWSGVHRRFPPLSAVPLPPKRGPGGWRSPASPGGPPPARQPPRH